MLCLRSSIVTLRHFTPEPSLRKLKYYLLYRKKHCSIRLVLGAFPFEGDDTSID